MRVFGGPREGTILGAAVTPLRLAKAARRANRSLVAASAPSFSTRTARRRRSRSPRARKSTAARVGSGADSPLGLGRASPSTFVDPQRQRRPRGPGIVERRPKRGNASSSRLRRCEGPRTIAPIRSWREISASMSAPSSPAAPLAETPDRTARRPAGRARHAGDRRGEAGHGSANSDPAAAGDAPDRRSAPPASNPPADGRRARRRDRPRSRRNRPAAIASRRRPGRALRSRTRPLHARGAAARASGARGAPDRRRRPAPKTRCLSRRRGVVDRDPARVAFAVREEGADQAVRVETVAASDPPEPGRQQFVAIGARRDRKAAHHPAARSAAFPARRPVVCVIETSGRMMSSPKL